MIKPSLNSLVWTFFLLLLIWLYFIFYSDSTTALEVHWLNTADCDSATTEWPYVMYSQSNSDGGVDAQALGGACQWSAVQKSCIKLNMQNFCTVDHLQIPQSLCVQGCLAFIGYWVTKQYYWVTYQYHADTILISAKNKVYMIVKSPLFPYCCAQSALLWV